MASNPIKSIASNNHDTKLETNINNLGDGRDLFTIKYKAIEISGIITKEKNIHENHFENIFIGNHNTYNNERIPLISRAVLNYGYSLIRNNGLVVYSHYSRMNGIMICNSNTFKASWADAKDNKGNFLQIENLLTHDEANLYFTYAETFELNKEILRLNSLYKPTAKKHTILTSNINF